MKGSWLKRVQRITIFLDCTFEVIQIISRGNLLSEGVIGIDRLIGFKNDNFKFINPFRMHIFHSFQNYSEYICHQDNALQAHWFKDNF